MAVALLLGIAGAVLGTQCPVQGMRIGICPEAGDAVVTGSTGAVPAPLPAAERARLVPPLVSREAAPAPAAVPAPAAETEEPAAAVAAHDLIEGSHDRLLQAQAARPLFRGGYGADREGGDGAAAPAQLAYAPPAPVAPPGTDGAARPPLRPAFGSEPPSPVVPEEGAEATDATAGVGGPLLPARPEPEPLSLPDPAADAAAADAPAAPQSAPLASAMRIGDSRVNVRSGPSTEEARLFVLDPGEPVMATEARDGWMKIEDATGRVGWIDAGLLEGSTAAADTGTEAAEPAAAESTGAEIRTVAGSGVSVREAPTTSGARLFALPAGEEVTVTGSDKGWLRIVDSRGRTGWAYSDLFTSGT